MQKRITVKVALTHGNSVSTKIMSWTKQTTLASLKWTVKPQIAMHFVTV